MPAKTFELHLIMNKYVRYHIVADTNYSYFHRNLLSPKYTESSIEDGKTVLNKVGDYISYAYTVEPPLFIQLYAKCLKFLNHSVATDETE